MSQKYFLQRTCILHIPGGEKTPTPKNSLNNDGNFSQSFFFPIVCAFHQPTMLVAPGIQKPRMTRTKTGCLNCRKRHKKCDEVKPQCSSCLKKSEDCQWPFHDLQKKSGSDSDSNNSIQNLDQYASQLLKNFREKSKAVSQSNSQSTTDSIFSPSKLPDPPLPESQNYPQIKPNDAPQRATAINHILNNNSPVNGESEGEPEPKDKTNRTPSSYNNNQVINYFSPTSLQGQINNPSPESTGDHKSAYTFSPTDSLAPFLLYNELHSTLRDYMFTSAELNEFSTSADFNNILWPQSPFIAKDPGKDSSKDLRELLANEFGKAQNPNAATNGNAKVSNILNSYNTELSPMEELDLFKNYLYEVAPWLDMFDYSRQFGTTVAQLAQGNKPLLYAIYAISSRQKELTHPGYPPEKTINLYQESLKNLIPTVNKIVDRGIISTCVILCVFEMMSSSPKEWRHHLEGCHALFEANDINGFSANLERRLFWCYARMDVNSALIGKQSTIIPSEKWLLKNCSVYDLKRLFLETGDEDMYANYIVFLCSRVLNLIAKDAENFEMEWEFLWNEVQEWCLNRPDNVKPMLSFDDKPFPGVLFLNGPAISANQLFHMAVILLIQNKPRLYKIKSTSCIVRICLAIENNHIY